MTFKVILRGFAPKNLFCLRYFGHEIAAALSMTAKKPACHSEHLGEESLSKKVGMFLILYITPKIKL